MALPPDIEDRTTPTGLMYQGWAYLRCAEVLQDNVGELPPKALMVVLQVLGQALELLLKAHLRAAGVTVKALSSERTKDREIRYGHSLTKLYTESRTKGLQCALSTDQHALLTNLDNLFGQPPFKTRYPYSGFYQAFPVDCRELEVFARSLMDELEKRFVPERVRNVGLCTSAHPARELDASEALTVEQAVTLLTSREMHAVAAEPPPSPLAGEGSGMGGELRTRSERAS